MNAKLRKSIRGQRLASYPLDNPAQISSVKTYPPQIQLNQSSPFVNTPNHIYHCLTHPMRYSPSYFMICPGCRASRLHHKFALHLRS